jgi:hypothetical protein
MMEGKLERSEMTKRTTQTTTAAMRLGRLGGKAGTSKQNAARKRNAQRAGRPRRVCITCNEPVVGGHVDRRLDASCGAHGWRWQRRDDPHVPNDDAVDTIVALVGRLSPAKRAELLARLNPPPSLDDEMAKLKTVMAAVRKA